MFSVLVLDTSRKKWRSLKQLEEIQFAFRRPESSALRVSVGHNPNEMEEPTASRGARAQGARQVHFASWATREVEAESAAG